jgi:putrescine aminotransferase
MARRCPGIPAVRDGYGQLVGDVAEVGARRSCDPRPRSSTSSTVRVAAFIGEPMIGAGGAIPPPDGYWPEVERICRDAGRAPRSATR